MKVRNLFGTPPDDPLLALPVVEIKPCPKCGLGPEGASSFDLRTGICTRCEPCLRLDPAERCLFVAGHEGDCVPSLKEGKRSAEP